MRKRSKSLALAVTLYGISTTLAQVASIENKHIILTIILFNILIWGYAGYVYFFASQQRVGSSHVHSLIRGLPEDNIVEYKFVDTTAELKNIWESDQLEYKETNIKFQLLKDWWLKNEKGLYIRKKGNIIQGSMGIWPISSDLFDQLLEYDKTDSQMRPIDIVSAENEKNSQYWYISGFFLHSKEDVFKEFVGKSFKVLLERLDGHTGMINICLLPLNKDEILMMDILGFIKVGEGNKQRFSMYCYTHNSLSHLRAKVSSLLQSEFAIDVYNAPSVDSIDN